MIAALLFGITLVGNGAMAPDGVLSANLKESAFASSNDWENTAVNSSGRLPPRTFALPLADMDSALSDALEPPTPYVLSLNGQWKISWCGEPGQRPTGF